MQSTRVEIQWFLNFKVFHAHTHTRCPLQLVLLASYPPHVPRQHCTQSDFRSLPRLFHVLETLWLAPIPPFPLYLADCWAIFLLNIKKKMYHPLEEMVCSPIKSLVLDVCVYNPTYKHICTHTLHEHSPVSQASTREGGSEISCRGLACSTAGAG